MVLIVLNGASTAGRSSIAAELRRRLGDGCLVTGFDAVMDEQARPVNGAGPPTWSRPIAGPSGTSAPAGTRW